MDFGCQKRKEGCAFVKKKTCEAYGYALKIPGKVLNVYKKASTTIDGHMFFGGAGVFLITQFHHEDGIATREWHGEIRGHYGFEKD